MRESSESLSRKEILKSSTLLNGLTEDQLSQLAMNSVIAYAEKSEVLWFSGQKVDFFGVVGTGFVKMTSVGPNHQEITTEIMGPGQVFGLLGALNGMGCPQSAKAVTGSWYLKVNKSEFLPHYHSNTVLREHIFRRTSYRLHQAFDLIAHLSVGTVEQRVAAVLLVLTKSFGQEKDGGILLDVPLTRQEISELAGTTVESTIRVISKWQKRGWVETNARHILLRSIDSIVNGSKKL
ncbi:MAG: Crp/Fnr family transcriptional regulator [Armatimonadetes bacterium]|nr:Crp/Fnr family transcriptional regulator [Armatimonadota bacterium]